MELNVKISFISIFSLFFWFSKIVLKIDNEIRFLHKVKV